ncbi:MAG: Gfo/Idh/MocA family oxidoreductase [Candidatus Sumerlaeia bacterium]|nr:Gfo/Idh/MocA family oxidoreductase [Candidatus Sumerlaeia bacterium]
MGAVAAAGVAAKLPIEQCAYAAGSDVIKVGVIGCGGRGTGAAINAAAADKGVRIVALGDIFADHVESARAQIQKAAPDQIAVDDAHCFAGFNAYKNVIASDAQVILIACASRFHPAYVKACIDAGKHVFVEKPHAIDPPGVRALAGYCEEAKAKNLIVASGLQMRHEPGVVECGNRILDGAVGDIVAMEVNFLRAPYVIREPRPEWSEIQFQFRNWYHFRWLSGDDVVQSLIHPIDICQRLMREEPPVMAHAMGGRAQLNDKKFGDVFDHTAVLYEYKNGVRLYGFVRTQYNCFNEYSVKVFGTKGRAFMIGQNYIEGATKWEYERKKGEAGGHQMEQNHLFAQLRAGKVFNNGLYMVRSTLAAILGQMAAYTGKRLLWTDAEKSNWAYEPAVADFNTEPPVKPNEKGIYPVPVPGETKLG